MKKKLIAGLVVASSLLTLTVPSYAGISLSGTRIVYSAKSKEASVLVKNQAKDDVMIQSWLEAPNDARSDLPFAITPSLSRLGGDKQQTLRIFYAGQGLATDRESVFWLNVQEIPQKPKGDNSLQIAVRQRIKLFYRPADLPGKPEDAAGQLKWRWAGDDGKPAMEVVNDSPYFVSVVRASLHIGSHAYKVVPEMIEPKSTRRLAVKDLSSLSAAADAKIEFESVNDFGAAVSTESTVSK
ncbi:fimbria/pilus periplasmic chaperone [Burkholderia contaminans]|uniref:Molecular chaperone n=1 Tax=Burkholderia reimsis TaxID=2234132 RepID=A0A365QUX2_9BURK|nr:MULTISPECIES: fimbria/pilus periplasmic chaperone [Burkholderia]MCA7916202.1 fimbria/pilus periplasmic chaperone [Burkholderia contaminans]MCA8102063.1 fimbria/pilus periplasmic chaperone [Burkholderia contaminans]RBB38945.1 molecular chaperone [Burkholderia reimsis]UUX40411.1 fimbria/pilus periplasmic chaperone [Burkholderia contaminans]